MTAVEVVQAPAAILGEGPMWSPCHRALFWVDIVGKKVFRFAPAAGDVTVRQLPYAPSAVIPCVGGELLLITKKGMAWLDFATARLDSIPMPAIDFTQEVFNDASCDRLGRLWVGTRDIKVAEAKGRLYCLDRDFSVTVHAEKLVISNGIAWSPDGATFYHVDSRPGRIDAYDFDLAAGKLSNRRTFLDYAHDGTGHPDGCTVDCEGGLWVAEVEGSRVARYAPDGRLDRVIEVPLSKPTSVMFGGDDLRTLYVTSMQFGISSTALAAQPLAGCLLALDPGVAGLAENCFAGGPTTKLSAS